MNIVAEREPVEKNGRAPGGEGTAWARAAGRLAPWVLERMVNRDDAYGRYYRDSEGKAKS